MNVTTRSQSGAGRSDHELPWVLVRVSGQIFAISATEVREMVSMPAVCSVPEVPGYVRGVINLRGRVMPLVDLRKRFGMQTIAEEIAGITALLEQREQDHRHWLDELEASVRERRPFTLALDPHECAFGRWYDTFETDNLLLDTQLKRFKEPHARVHAVGRDVIRLCEAGRHDEALDVITHSRTGALAHLISLFGDTRAILSETSREIAVVVEPDGRGFAAAVDSIESVERLPASGMTAIGDVLCGAPQEFVSAVGRRAKDSALVLIIEGARLLNGAVTA